MVATLLAQLGSASDQYAVQLCDRILAIGCDASRERCALDAAEAGLVLRLRVDGQLSELGKIPQGVQTNIAARFKSMAAC